MALKVLHTSDSPHDVAMGAGIAMFVAFTPLLGLQTLIAIGLAALVRANKAICIPIVWITNPFTALPIYTGCWWVGRLLWPAGAGPGKEAILTTLQQHQSVSLLKRGFWSDLYHVLGELGLELWLGCFVVGIVCALLSYALARWGVTSYRETRRQRLLKRSLRRAERETANVIRRTE